MRCAIAWRAPVASALSNGRGPRSGKPIGGHGIMCAPNVCRRCKRCWAQVRDCTSAKQTARHAAAAMPNHSSLRETADFTMGEGALHVRIPSEEPGRIDRTRRRISPGVDRLLPGCQAWFHSSDTRLSTATAHGRGFAWPRARSCVPPRASAWTASPGAAPVAAPEPVPPTSLRASSVLDRARRPRYPCLGGTWMRQPTHARRFPSLNPQEATVDYERQYQEF